MRTRLKYPYPILREKFVRGTMSLRQLARDEGVDPSALGQQARKTDDKGRTWYDLRAEYQTRSSDKAIELLARHEAERQLRLAVAAEEGVEAVIDAIRKMRVDMQATRTVVRSRLVDPDTGELEHYEVEEPLVRFGPRELVQLIDRINVMAGKPMSITEDRGLNINVRTDALGTERALKILDATRGVAGASTGASEGSSLPSPEGHRPN